MGRMLRTRLNGRVGKVGLDDCRFLPSIQASVTTTKSAIFFRGIFHSVKDVLC
jgi:hypothetical protein